MENYKNDTETFSEINTLVNCLYKNINNESDKLIFLEVLENVSCSESEFLNDFIKFHQEIRNGNISKIRHFILMKKSKIIKDNNNCLPLLDIIESFSTETQFNYWNYIQQIYILLESMSKNSNDSVINTLSIEIEKRENKEKDLKEEKIRIAKEKQANKEKSMELREELANRQNIPSMTELLGQLGDNPEINSMISNLTGGKSNSELDNMLKHAMTQQPELGNMLSTMMSQVSGDDNNDESFNVENMLKSFIPDSFMPNSDTTNTTNIVLVNKILKDIEYVFTKNDESKLEDRLLEKINIYKNMFMSGKLSPVEIVICLCKITSNPESKDRLKSLDVVDMSMSQMIEIGLKLIPKEMMDNFGNMNGLGDLIKMGQGNDKNINIGEIISTFTGMNLGQDKEIVVEEDLTEEQLLELEKYYDENC